MKDKICVITGANSGIGKETAKALAKMGAFVIMVCRNPNKGRLALEEIIAHSGNKNIDLMIADLSSLREIKKLAVDMAKKYNHIDVLINNAGVFCMKREESADGTEMTFAVNYLAPFYLTNQLLPLLKTTPQGRIIIVSSMLEKFGKLSWHDIEFKRTFYNPVRAYSNSKLMTIIYTKALARKLLGTQVTVNALHPGGVATHLGMEKGNWLYRLVWKLGSLFFISAEKGAETSVYLASSPEVSNITGEFFSNKKIRKANPLSNHKENAEKLWKMSEEYITEHNKDI